MGYRVENHPPHREGMRRRADKQRAAPNPFEF